MTGREGSGRLECRPADEEVDMTVAPDSVTLPTNRPSSVGRLLRRLRLAAGLSQADAALAVEVSLRRLKELERGATTLGYIEGLRLAKAYLLCPPCFRRAFEAAFEREGLDVPDVPEG